MNDSSSAHDAKAPDSRPGMLHRGVLGGGTVSGPGMPVQADLQDAWADAPSGPATPARFGKRHIFAALAVFAVVVVALATWGRDVRSARVSSPSSGAAAVTVDR